MPTPCPNPLSKSPPYQICIILYLNIVSKYVIQYIDNIVKLVYNFLYMLQPIIVTARDILRNYKNIITKVKDTKQPALVMSQKEPQVAIVSLEDFEKLQNLRYKNSAKSLLDTTMQYANCSRTRPYRLIYPSGMIFIPTKMLQINTDENCYC